MRWETVLKTSELHIPYIASLITKAFYSRNYIYQFTRVRIKAWCCENVKEKMASRQCVHSCVDNCVEKFGESLKPTKAFHEDGKKLAQNVCYQYKTYTHLYF